MCLNKHSEGVGRKWGMCDFRRPLPIYLPRWGSKSSGDCAGLMGTDPRFMNSDSAPAEDPTVVCVAEGPLAYEPTGVNATVEAALRGLELAPDFIRPGDRVVLKPNWVKEHDERHPGPDAWEHVVTHPSVIDAVIRWVAPQLDASGSIIVCDAPQTDSSFAKIREYCRLDAVIEGCRIDYPGLTIELLDLRPVEWNAIDGVTVGRTELPGDPLGPTRVRLDDDSEFVGFSGLGQLYGASYDVAETNRHHSGGRHEYLLCRTPMEADVFINLPKLKTHKKVGITCALKNLVGINADKNWLPHYTEGTPDRGGDQFRTSTAKTRFEHTSMGKIKAFLRNRGRLSRLFVPVKKVGRMIFGDTQEVVRSGNWYGNDTCWRMVLDLNKCLWFHDGEGKRRPMPRRYLAVVDGIIGGEGNGPMAPDAKACGLVIAGTHPVAVDSVCATLMGFDWERIPMLHGAYQMGGLDFVPFNADEVRIRAKNQDWEGPLAEMTGTFDFQPHFGWVGAIESARTPMPSA
jgi:uncharacterized protein (DUF362 family)